MKGNSDNYPQIIEKSVGKTQIRYDVEEVTRVDADGTTRMSYDFSYVEVVGDLTRAKIINAVIENMYTKDAEIALINNEITNPGTPEYVEYQALRVKAKEVADGVSQ